MKIAELSIPDVLKAKFIDQGIEELYPPQAEAIEKGLLQDQNMVVAIPTASGKTLIAILAIFSALHRFQGSKAIFLAPLRALASEKYEEIKAYADILGFKVAISTGDMDETSGWLGASDIIIATNEKFDSLIRHQVGWLNDIQVVVSDEVHLINDSHRGPVLEVVLTLLRRNLPNCQLVALSATISNAKEIAEWLDADLILSEWRPVDLKEAVWHEGRMYYGSGKQEDAGNPKDKTGYVSLSQEILEEGGQALIFTNTRKSSMATADILAPKIFSRLNTTEQEQLLNLANEIRSNGEKTQIRERLAHCVQRGVAFHHAGLISTHRRLVENGFKARLIKIITATPTLAAGVNLPGRRVIIRSLSRYSGYGYERIPNLEYKQMAGRAGRPRYDPYGEAIILAKNRDEVQEYLDGYIRAGTETIISKLGTEPAMRAHILAFIASEYVDTFESALEMLDYTFYGYQYGATGNFLVEDGVFQVFELLTEAKLISVEEPYQVTPFGKRVSELYLDPLSARNIKLGLESKQKGESPSIAYLQLLASTPDIRNYNVREREMDLIIDLAEKHTDDWLRSTESEEQQEFEIDIFFTTIKSAAIVQAWLEEETEENIFIKFGVSSGDLHAILERMNWLVHSGLEISKIFNWDHHRTSLKLLQDRLKYGINEELLQLVAIPGVGRIRARTLYDAGLTSVSSILNTSDEKIASLPGFGTKIATRLKKQLRGENIEIEEEGIQTVDEKSNVQTTLSSFFD